MVYYPNTGYSWLTAENERHIHKDFLRCVNNPLQPQDCYYNGRLYCTPLNVQVAVCAASLNHTHNHSSPIPTYLSPSHSSGHTADVYDLAWAPDSAALVSGAVDRTARVWDLLKGPAGGKEVAKLEGHTQFVQGVAWDPAGAFVVTESNDRSARVWRTPLAAATERARRVAAGGPKGAAAGKKAAESDFALVATLKMRDITGPPLPLPVGEGAAAAAEPATAATETHHA